MYKFLLPLAFAAFALVACSDDKSSPSHAELCAKKPITKECLTGKWGLEKVEGSLECIYTADTGTLKLKADRQYTFEGGKVTVEGDKNYEVETNGYWELKENGTVMEIKCTIGDFESCNPNNPPATNAKIEISGLYLKVTFKGHTSFLQACTGSTTTFTEVFAWKGNN